MPYANTNEKQTCYSVIIRQILFIYDTQKQEHKKYQNIYLAGVKIFRGVTCYVTKDILRNSPYNNNSLHSCLLQLFTADHCSGTTSLF